MIMLQIMLLFLFPPAAFGFIAPCHHHHNYDQRKSSFARTRQSLSKTSGDHETLSSLSEKLIQLRQEAVEDPETVRLSLLYSRLSNLQLNRTRVANSAIAGRGLYARCGCQKGDLLTCYPGDALIIIPDDEDWTVLWGDHVSEPCDDIDDLLGYIVHVNDDIGVVGLPSLDQDPAYLGHFANDGAAMPVTESALSSYVIESEQKANAMHNAIDGGSHMVTVATRNIAEGEEIFVTYGPEYWMEQPSFTGADEPTEIGQSSSGRGFG